MGKNKNTLVPTGSSSTVMPSWYTDAAKKALGYADTFYKQPFQDYTGQRVAGLSSDTQAAMANIRGLVAPPASTERIVDENGRLGSISSYMNPYIDATLAPTLRNLSSANTQQMHAIGSGAQFSGGYGDARHGIAEGQQAQAYDTAVGDATGSAYSAAYNNAMALRSGDLSRMDASQNQEYQDKLAQINAQMTAGTLTQQNAQNAMDAAYQEFLRKQQDSYDKLTTLLGALGSVNSGQTTTTTGPKTYPFLQSIGAGIGAGVGAAVGAA